MSSTVISKGFIAILKNPIPEDNIEDYIEFLYDKKSSLRVNSEGTLIYNNTVPFENREEFYGLHIGVNRESVQQFVDEVLENEIEIDEESIEQYSEIWYNGGDSGVSILTLDKYKSILAKVQIE